MIDISKITHTPCYVIDEKKLISNLEILNDLEKTTGCHVLLAQKAFSMFYEYPLIAKYVTGACSSGLYEAKLAHEYMPGKEVQVYSGAYRQNDIKEISEICDKVIFNSFSQLQKYKNVILSAGKECGIRINPEISTQSSTADYDPCVPESRLGVTLSEFREDLLDGVLGLHFHTLCEQNSDALEKTLKVVEENFGKFLYKIKWLNIGGGHHITRKNYDICLLKKCIRHIQEKYNIEVYIEPGEAFALNAGYLVTEVLDIIHNGCDIAILDTSAECHMPDVIEMPYRPPLFGAGEPDEKKYTYLLGSQTCLSGDVMGKYSFDEPLTVGDRLIFEDMAIYTMCKNNTFNGLPLPDISVFDRDGNYKVIKEFGYDDFKNRLS